MRKIFPVIFFSLIFFSCKKDKQDDVSTELLMSKIGTSAGIYDQQGRYVILRGVNYNVLGDYWQGNSAIATTKKYEENDLKLMAKYGINCIRLIFSWSKLEPQRGNYNQEYIQQIKQVIEDAAKYHIYILLDMHQDAWGKFIATPSTATCGMPNKGWDGAPEWATITGSVSTCTADGSRESAPAVYYAFENFWSNTDGINDACTNAWQELVKSTSHYSNVVGYDLINEPNLGYESINIEARKLSNYYQKLTEAIREAENSAHSYQHIIFFEMSVTCNGQPVPFIPFPDFTADKNSIFAPHLYFESISNALTIEQGYDLVKTLSGLYKTNIFVGEWGFFGDPVSDVTKVKRFAKKEDANFAGSTWWQWSQAPGDPHGISWDGTQYANTNMMLIELDKNGNYTGNNNELYLNVLSRTRPNAICGEPVKLLSNPDDGTMHLEVETTDVGVTILWIPDRFGTPKITGTNISDVQLNQVDGGYSADVKVDGNYSIDVQF